MYDVPNSLVVKIATIAENINYVLIQVNDLTLLTVSRSINSILIILIPVKQQYKTTLSNYTRND